MATIRYDPEFFQAKAAQPARPELNAETAHELRQSVDEFLKIAFSNLPPTPDVEETKFTVKSYDDFSVNIHRFATQEMIHSATPQPAVLYMHGGGLVAGSVDIYAPAIRGNVNRSKIAFFAVDYRLAPESPAPAATEDCFAALKYITSHAVEFNIDPKRIAVMGDSAGGCLAATTAIVARDRGLDPPLAKQILVYPMLDDRTHFAPEARLHKFLTWTANDNVLGWGAALGTDRAGKPEADVSAAEVPARCEELSGLPSAHIDVGSLDLFRDETIEYAARLLKADVEVELHVWPGVPHGFESAGVTTWAVRALASRFRALGSF